MSRIGGRRRALVGSGQLFARRPQDGYDRTDIAEGGAGCPLWRRRRADTGPLERHPRAPAVASHAARFQPGTAAHGTLETLVAAASSASTSSNLQTWSVVAVTDHATKVELSKVGANQKYIVECPLFLVWIADLSRNNRLAAEEGVHLDGNDTLEMMLMASIDATLAAQNASVAAKSSASTCATSAA